MKVLDGWKVVRQCWGNRGFKSALDHGAVHIYSFRKFVKPMKGCGPFAVFKTKLAAVRFRDGNQMVVKCKYVKSSEGNLYYYSEGIKLRLWFDIPAGTVLASKVKLVRRLYG